MRGIEFARKALDDLERGLKDDCREIRSFLNDSCFDLHIKPLKINRRMTV